MEEVQILDIGARLKTRRLELGYSLKDAAEYTRIRKVYLESLEANRFEELPGKVYVSGFLKAYARYLELDVDSLLNDLPSLVDDSRLSEDRAETVPEVLSPGIWGVIFAGLMVVLSISAAIYFLPGMLMSGQSEVSTPGLVTVTEKAVSVQEPQPLEGDHAAEMVLESTPPDEVKVQPQ